MLVQDGHKREKERREGSSFLLSFPQTELSIVIKFKFIKEKVKFKVQCLNHTSHTASHI